MSAALAAAAPAGAQTSSSATLRLVLLEDRPARVSVTLDDPLEALVKASSSAIVDIQTLPCYYSGGDFRLRAAPNDAPLPEASSAIALESDSETALIFPPDPSLAEALMRYAKDPASFPTPWTVQLSSRAIGLSQARGAEGEQLISAQIDPRSENARWLSTVAVLYRLRWNGRDVSVVFAGRVYGGLGRLVSALAPERAKGPFVGVARGGLFWQPVPGKPRRELVDKLQALGLRYSAAGVSEIRHWEDLSLYLSSPEPGVRFLSANLVYSSAPTVSLLPSSAITVEDGLRVAFIGLTPRSAAKFLGQAGLGRATIADPLTALTARLPALRAQADVVVLLTAVDEDTESLARRAGGVDLIVGRDEYYSRGSPVPERRAFQRGRREFDPPLWMMNLPDVSLSVLEASIDKRAGFTDWTLRERHERLVDDLPEAPGHEPFDPERYGITPSTDPVLIPSPRRMYGEAPGAPQQVSARDFWTLAASLLADKAHAEVALLRVSSLYVQAAGDIKEGVARVWLNTEDAAILTTLKGRELRPLLAEAEAQRWRESKGQAPGPTRYTAGAVEIGPRVAGAPRC